MKKDDDGLPSDAFFVTVSLMILVLILIVMSGKVLASPRQYTISCDPMPGETVDSYRLYDGQTLIAEEQVCAFTVTVDEKATYKIAPVISGTEQVPNIVNINQVPKVEVIVNVQVNEI